MGDVNSVLHAEGGGVNMIYDISIRSADILASISVYRQKDRIRHSLVVCASMCRVAGHGPRSSKLSVNAHQFCVAMTTSKT